MRMMDSKIFACLCVVLVAIHNSVYCCNENVRLLDNLEFRSSEIPLSFMDKSRMVNDVSLSSRWYSATLYGWQYLMTDATNKPSFLRCSTYWPIYLKEKHVPLNDLGEDPTDVFACVLDALGLCKTKYKIQIRKCNDEIQYKLKSTTWLSGFCFEKHEFLNRSTPFPAPENVDFGTITVRPELNFTEETGIFLLTEIKPYLIFWCQFDKETDLFYTVTWYINETPLNETMGPSKDMADLILTEEKLSSSNYSLGINIRCGVSASIGVDGMLSAIKKGETFYAGIKIRDTNIYLDKETEAVVQIESTVPIGCQYIKGIDTNDVCKLGMSIFVNDDQSLQCERESVLMKAPKEIENQHCVQNIKTLAEGDAWDPSTQFNFTIVTSDHNYDDHSEFLLQLEFPKTVGETIWKNYFFPEIKVFVRNTEKYKSKICKSRNDPHMTTADGYRYENHEEGTYMLYINHKYKIEVQQIIKQCDYGWTNAKCTCAVAVSAGQDVFMINRCGEVTLFGFTQCGDGGILDVQRINDNMYKVFTPIGTRISIQLFSWNIWMNVDITMAPKDMGNVDGLCGRVDGDKSNDLTHRHSKVFTPLGKERYNYHLEFSKSWRIEDNSDENLFRPTLRTLTPWVRDNGLYCVCNSENRVNKALCSPTQYLNCTKIGSITNTKCHIEGRRKRGVGNHSSKEIQRILSKIAVQSTSRKKRDAVQEIVITEESKSICRNKISGIPALTDFTDLGSNDNEEIVLQQCEFDLSVVKDTSWADVHVEAVNDGVKNMLDLQPTVVENNSEKVKTFYINTCPMNCSNQGECVESGICSCFTYYMGPDCSIDERDGLTIFDIEGEGECDLAGGEECECFYVRSENIQNNFTCSVNTSKILKNGSVESVSSKTLKGGFEDIFTGICCAPDSISGQRDVFVAQYTVSIGNNGINFGNAESVYVFDSECQSISTSESGSKTFSLKDDHCFIDGYCFSEYDMAPVGCRACQSSKSLYNWTDYDPCQNGGKCSDETAGYTCTCMPGYRGINCEYEINECLSTPCQNGGVCTDMLNKYTCECPDGFIGYNCQTDIDECSSNPCKNGALCINDINMYQCNCSDGYEGTNCEQNIDECASNPCQNGGTCRDLIANFECECVDGYEGITCNTDINECISNPCKNEGTCNDLVNEYECTCAEGYTGSNCEIDACTVQPCHNGGTCKLESNSYMCLCVDGYDGQNCDNDINECQSNPCTNGGTCRDLANSFECVCVPGYDGTICNNEIDECLSTPCLNSGNCTDLLNAFSCECPIGFSGRNCQTDINECTSNPCKNGALCIDDVNMYRCKCSDGFEGTNCEQNINECASNPCQNGGTCIDLVANFKCECVIGYEGMTCSTEINECISSPCKNGGTCHDLLNRYECSCAYGYNGTDCEIDECTVEPCQNGGTCIISNNSYTCFCAPGYDGQNCEKDINECQSNPCENGGTCKNLLNSFECACVQGYDGIMCENDINECSSNPCKNGAICINDVNMYKCNCSDGYEGTNCEQNINECASNPCKNGGTCIDLVAEFQCECLPGYEDVTCSTDIDDCASEPCLNGGTCEDIVNGYNCTCVDGYDGADCSNIVKSASGSLVTDIVQKKIKIVFHVESVISVTDPILKEDITYQLTGMYKRALGNKLKEVVILDLRIGSLVVDFEVIYVKDSSSVTDLTDANLDLIKGEKTIDVLNETVRAISVSVGNVTVTNSSIVDDENVCAFFTALNGNCKGSLKCSVMKGRPSCWSELKEGDDSDLTLLIVIVVCFVLVFVIIAGVSACVGFHIIRKRKSKDKFSFRYDVNIVVNNPTMRGCNKSRLTTDSFELMPDFQDSNPSMPTEEQKE